VYIQLTRSGAYTKCPEIITTNNITKNDLDISYIHVDLFRGRMEKNLRNTR
jgi:hypothetical protein